MTNELTLGLDISTSTIGYCIVDSDKKLISMSYVKLASVKDLFEKVTMFQEVLMKYKGLITHVAIEDPLVMFQPGFSRAQILSLLSRFNGMCSTVAYFVYSKVPVYYNVNHARKLALPNMKFTKGCDRKQVVLEHISRMYPDVDWPRKPKATNSDGTFKLKDECFDMADAAVIALAHVEAMRSGEYRVA